MASKVDPTVRWKTPGPQPNGLQASDAGLWVIDQKDPNRIYLLSYEGDLIRGYGESRARHGSGITLDPDGNLWVSSTYTYEMILFNAATGAEIRAFPTPAYDRRGGAHGAEWRHGQLWFNVPVTGRIFRADPATGRVLGDIPAHGDRAHGMAWDPHDGSLWCADTNKRVIFKLDPATGAILDAVGVAGPEPHGMTIRNGTFWLCDAGTREVFTVDVPRR